MMKKIKLGRTTLNVTQLGFGGLPIQRTDTKKAVETIQYALELGINFIETGPAYGDSEIKIGIALKEFKKKSVVIASKSMKRNSEEFKKDLYGSLKNIGVDCIDLYQFHQVKDEADYKEIIKPGGVFDTAKWALKEGLIKNIGASSHSLEVCEILIKSKLFKSIQFPANFLSTEYLESAYPLAVEHQLGIIGMKPFVGGVVSNVGAAIRYLKAYENLIICPGFETKNEVEQVYKIYRSNARLSLEDNRYIQSVNKRIGKYYCRRCGYCAPCTKKINIPLVLSFESFVNRFRDDIVLKIRDEMRRVGNCKRCLACVKRCPYNLPIPDLLKRKKLKFERSYGIVEIKK